MIELACTFAKSRFPATLVFMAVAGEEQGLLGAAHWAKVRARPRRECRGDDHQRHRRQRATTKPAAATRATCACSPKASRPARTSPRSGSSRLATGGENDSPARELARTIRDAAQRYVPEMTVKVVYRRDRYLRGGDHIPFLAQGYTAVRFTEAHEDFRHQHQDVRVVDGVQFGDLPQFVDFDVPGRASRA